MGENASGAMKIADGLPMRAVPAFSGKPHGMWEDGSWRYFMPMKIGDNGNKSPKNKLKK